MRGAGISSPLADFFFMQIGKAFLWRNVIQLTPTYCYYFIAESFENNTWRI